MSKKYISALILLCLFVTVPSARAMYDPETGRFLTRERLGTQTNVNYSKSGNPILSGNLSPLRQYVDGMSLYAYVGNMPVRFTDTLGLQFGFPWEPHPYSPSEPSLPEKCLNRRIDPKMLTQEEGLGKELLALLKDIGSVQHNANVLRYDLKKEAKKAFIETGKNMGCPISLNYWATTKSTSGTIEYDESFDGYATIHRYSLIGIVRCGFLKRCCNDCNKSLPIAPCGKVNGLCAITFSLKDKYDFSNPIFNAIGDMHGPHDYLINLSWIDSMFGLGPKTLCPYD